MSRRNRFAEAAEARALVALAERFLWIPFFRKNVIRKAIAQAQSASDASERHRHKARRQAGLHRHLSAIAARAVTTASRLEKARAAAPSLGVPPKAIEDRAIELWGRSRSLLRGSRNPEWLDRACAVSEGHVELMLEWVAHRRRVSVDEGRRRRVMSAAVGAAPSRPIYLPIPLAMGREAMALGATRDSKAAPGTSPFFVRTDQDLQPFGDMLPLAYRGSRPNFEFPPIPLKAAGQNLWGVFERDTWNRVRKINYGMTGHRCAICGGRGGYIADKILGPEEKRFGVDCHEVWEWDQPDADTGVGIQRLRRLLVVCPSCHSTFHSAYFTRLGANKGMGAEVADFIENRRMLINGVNAETLIEQLDLARDKLNEIKSVDKWILDLETLGQQQYMLDHGAVMLERNSAGIPADRIAGIAFSTDAGDRFLARPSDEVYREVTSRYQSENNAVRFQR